MLVTLGDYAALVIQFGYYIIRGRISSSTYSPCLVTFKFAWMVGSSVKHQRPEPRPAEDIGVWQNMINFYHMSLYSMFGMLFFTSDLLRGMMRQD